MPSEKTLELKKQQVAALSEALKSSCAGIIVDYKGISVADDTALRKKLREGGDEADMRYYFRGYYTLTQIGKNEWLYTTVEPYTD